MAAIMALADDEAEEIQVGTEQALASLAFKSLYFFGGVGVGETGGVPSRPG
jgi:hypothetical protein